MTKQEKFYVVRTAFHGGGIVSRHQSLQGATQAMLRYRGSNCECTCAGVVSQKAFEALPSHEDVSQYWALCK